MNPPQVYMCPQHPKCSEIPKGCALSALLVWRGIGTQWTSSSLRISRKDLDVTGGRGRWSSDITSDINTLSWDFYCSSFREYYYEALVLCWASHFSCVWLFATLWTCQAPLPIGFSRQEYWSGLPCPPPGDLPNPGIELESHVSCIGRRFCTTSTTWERLQALINLQIQIYIPTNGFLFSWTEGQRGES